ncbi:PKD domain-containing protein [Myxococcus sp. K15C18031901]|uniref:PKD domain-containing protein n=1 Tax=Myxococcus dinghuensis TaxID=2906761 RepID=UPI0020A76F3D|nr:PKD domain-containing protein [Myxococcus dinghuensis]MCP3097740.1 PKD domain-containing protein [Myxococcus dinghuensis]
MPLAPSRLRAVVTLGLMVAVGPWATGCHRSVRVDLGEDRTVEAGVPVELGSKEPGAPKVTWEPGDGTPTFEGARLSHAYARAGTYTARALVSGEEVARVKFTVVPRPVLRAVPAQARSVLWIPRLRGNLEPLVDFYERLIGAENARQELEATPLMALLLRGIDGGPSVVDPDEGAGFFFLPEFDGTVALVGVTEPEAAMEAVLRAAQEAGHEVSPLEDGAARLRSAEDGEEMLLFTDRGYLYLVVPESPEVPEDGAPVQAMAVVPPAPTTDMAYPRQVVTGLTGAGLSEEPLLHELRAKVAEGSVYLYSGPPADDGEEPPPLRGVFASLSVKPDRVDLDGFMSSTRPLFQGASAPASALLSQTALGPVAAAQLSIPPEELAKLAFGSPGSERRVRTLERWRERGLDAEALLKALRGDVAMLVYFDAPAFLKHLIQNKSPEVRGSVLVDAGLTSAEPVLRLIDEHLEASPLRYQAEKVAGGKVYRTLLKGQPVELKVGPERATLVAGEVLEGRPRGDVGAALRERFGGEAFGAGHVSLMVDLGQLRADLRATKAVPGVSTAELVTAKSFMGALLEQLTPLELGFLDFSLVEGGARVKGRLTVRDDGWESMR